MIFPADRILVWFLLVSRASRRGVWDSLCHAFVFRLFITLLRRVDRNEVRRVKYPVRSRWLGAALLETRTAGLAVP